MHDQQPGRITRLGRFERDAVRRQFKIEEVASHHHLL
jgi:hypothetical protein